MTAFITLLILALASSSVFSLPPGARNRPAGAEDESEVVSDESEETDEQQGATDTIEAANVQLGRLRGGPYIEYGDIAQSLATRNAAPCTAKGCTWPKASNGFAYVPIYISTRYSNAERRVIIQSLVAFHSVSCIRFVWRLTQVAYLYFYPSTGCWSYVGRQGRRQVISIQQPGCVYTQVIQHELLHALGFHHEQTRSDRDDHVNIVTQNIQPANLRNFDKVETNNLATPYDYDSIMHYSRYAFSKQYGVLPTIVPKPDSKVAIGQAKEMSENDIERVNRLYQCSVNWN